MPSPGASETEPGAGVPWLFAYGTLGPRGGAAAEAAGGWHADAVRGRLYDLGPYPALIDPDDPAAGWVEGHVRPVDRDELERHLDPYEGVDKGLYRRVVATTRDGRRAWVYAYARPLPASARGPFRSWGGP
jgi:gamma-glutamylcyclotransferase (GGCT)/AIG2-like uncharacterized protein YtfP